MKILRGTKIIISNFWDQKLVKKWFHRKSEWQERFSNFHNESNLEKKPEFFLELIF